MKQAGAVLVVISFILIYPYEAAAQVRISEIAWMGTVASGNDEWIELHNTGSSPIDIVDWTITSTGGLAVTISSTAPLAPGGYFVLERSDDATLPNIAADQLYTGALANSGDTLTLKSSAGIVVDTVAGGENWERVGGDNVTKHTAQRTESGWVTGAPTPKAENVTTGTSPGSEGTSEDDETTRTIEAVSEEEEDNEEEVKAFSISLGADRTIFVGSQIDYTAAVKGLGEIASRRVRYDWNFGNGDTRTGTDPTYRYLRPGKYVVQVTARYRTITAIDRMTLTVVPATINVSTAEGVVVLTNDASQEYDLSNSYLKAGERRFTIPSGTILLPNSTVSFVDRTTGFTTSSSTPVQLYTRSDELLATHEEVVEPSVEQVDTEQIAKAIPVQQGSSVSVARIEPPPTNTQTEEDPELPPELTEEAAGEGVAAVGIAPTVPWKWLVALAGVLVLAGASLVGIHRLGKEAIEIVEHAP